MLEKEYQDYDITLFCSSGFNFSVCLIIAFWSIILNIKDKALVKENFGQLFWACWEGVTPKRRGWWRWRRAELVLDRGIFMDLLAYYVRKVGEQ